MTTTKSTDRLLFWLDLIIKILMTLTVVGGLLLAGLAVAMPFFTDEGLAKMAEGLTREGALGMSLMLALAVVLMIMAFRFFSALRAILRTVGEGDPFAPENADRLEFMGHIAVIGFMLMMVIVGIGIWVKSQAPEAEIDITVDFGILIMALVLFVLARVFRHGAQMRQDLEGTV